MCSQSNRMQPLVSIIMPAYNSEDFIAEAIETVRKQTYENWELIIVDDQSSDITYQIIKDYSIEDTRIKQDQLEVNSGAASARNRAVELAKGTFIAFLDSDDLWRPNKLELQINFMIENDYAFTSTDYDKIDDEGKSLNHTVKSFPKLDYDGLLRECPGNSTVIYNAEKLGKYKIPQIKKRNDYLMWLQVIKKSKDLYGLQETLTSHRIREGSLSNNKITLVKYHWKIYRTIENLSVYKSVRLIIYWTLKKLLNR